MAEKSQKDDGGSISIADAIKLQDNLKKEVDFDKPDNELTPEEFAKKAIYLALDEQIEKSLGTDTKRDIDEKRSQMAALSKFQTHLNKLVELGKEIEKNFTWQGAYLINHFDKGKDNHFKVVVDGMTTDVVNKDKQMSDAERVEFAKKILEIIKVYRDKVANELNAKHEIISALIPSLEQTFNQTEWDLFGKEVGNQESADTMKSQFAEWLSLSKELLKSRKKATEAVAEDLEIEELLPNYVIQNEGDISKNLSAVEIKTKGERMVRLINEADTAEKEIEGKRSPLSEQLFGKPETYMDFGKTDDSQQSKPETKSGGMGLKTKWFIVIALSIVALSWGIWTAIGVFVLGVIMIGVLKNNG